MAKKPKNENEQARGDETTPAPEEAAAESAATEPEGTPDDTVDATAPLLKVDFKFHREYRKHATTGEIVAVELVNGTLNGVRLCSKPEEQTAGALPVMQLEDRESDVGQWYRAEALNFRVWEPPQPPRALMQKLMALYEESEEARRRLESAKLTHKHAKAVVEDVDERIFHLLRRIHETPGQGELPLDGADGEPDDEPELPLEPEMSEETAQEVLDIIAPEEKKPEGE